MRSRPRHVLAFVDHSRGSDAVVAAAQELATSSRAELTLLAVAVVEGERPGCCDLRSGVWNRAQRELAAEQLQTAKARLAHGVRPTLAVAEGLLGVGLGVSEHRQQQERWWSSPHLLTQPGGGPK